MYILCHYTTSLIIKCRHLFGYKMSHTVKVGYLVLLHLYLLYICSKASVKATSREASVAVLVFAFLHQAAGCTRRM